MSRTDEPSIRSIGIAIALMAAVAALSESMAIPIVANAQWSRHGFEAVPLYDLTQTRDPELIALAERFIAEDEYLAEHYENPKIDDVLGFDASQVYVGRVRIEPNGQPWVAVVIGAAAYCGTAGCSSSALFAKRSGEWHLEGGFYGFDPPPAPRAILLTTSPVVGRIPKRYTGVGPAQLFPVLINGRRVIRDADGGQFWDGKEWEVFCRRCNELG
ncbi:MAG: hypothetical protein C6Y20_07805 [Tagaea sp. CACIAM 22H2]|nr:hypothetical protein [Tagaea sp. CACIAM 22H2]